jgi:hypothetical protein
MNKQPVFLIGVALVLAAIYIAYFTDSFKPKNIHVYWRISPANADVVVFYLDKPYPLTSVKVVRTAEALTNQHPHALWHMVAQSDPAPTATFNYGGNIPGMKPELPSAQPEQLQPDTEYSVVIEAGRKLKGEKSFTLK